MVYFLPIADLGHHFRMLRYGPPNLPFVAVAEIGFCLIMLFGGEIAPVVHLAMLAALVLAFPLGRMEIGYQLEEARRYHFG